jgi:2-methylaconitate cis-trans-isomerase PrpF
MDICARAISVGKLHKAYPMTVAVGTGAAARIPNTVVNEIANPKHDQDIICIGHSSGTTDVDVKMNGEKVIKGGVTRTARRIMDGFVYIRD